MVREEECVRHDLPCLIPRDVLLIDKETHQLGDGKRRVRLWIHISQSNIREDNVETHIIELDGDICNVNLLMSNIYDGIENH